MSRLPMLAGVVVVVTGHVLFIGEGTQAGAPRSVHPPERLSETGLYLPGTTTVAPENLPFSPQYPLWTDGADKARWVHLPRGATIDARQVDAWTLPVGARFWKEFSYAGKKIETRMIWRASRRQWVYAAYAWDAEGKDATLVPQGKRHAHPLAGGGSHHIPSQQDCVACHEAGRGPILGFNALQLSDDRDPLAPHATPLTPGMVTNRTLVDTGRLRPARPELVTDPPRIAARTPGERAALGYLSANCGGCHNGAGPLARLGLDLAAGHAAITSLVDVPGKWVVPGVAPETSRRVAPGAPDRSALVYRMRSRSPLSQMPPLGTVTPDEEAIRLIQDWIARDLVAHGP